MSIKYESFDVQNSTLAYTSTDNLHGYEDEYEDGPEMVLALSGNEAALIHGTPEDILAMLESARASVVAHLGDQAAAENTTAVLLSTEPEATHEHTWRLTEGGYERTWATRIETDDNGVEKVATTYEGSSDFSEGGDGKLLLVCSGCLTERPAPSSDDITWE